MTLAWPPEPDPHYDPVVLDTERNVVVSLDEATAALAPSLPGRAATTANDAESEWIRADALASFVPEASSAAWRTTRQRLVESAENARAIPQWLLRLREWLLLLQDWMRQVRAWALQSHPAARVLIGALALLATAQAGVLAYLLLTWRAQGAVAVAAQIPPVSTPAATEHTAPPAPPVPGEATPDSAPIAAAQNAPAADPKLPEEAPRVAVKLARLVIQDAPVGARVFIDERRRGTAPLILDDLTAGTHTVRIEGNGLSVVEQVTLQAGSTMSLLLPAVQSSWVEIDSPIEVRIFEGSQLVGSSASGPIKVRPGTHRFDLRNDALGYTGRAQVSVTAGEVSRVKPVLPEGVLQVNALPWAHVWLDGRPVGDTPLGTLRASVGPHEVRFRHPERGEQVRQVVVSALGPTRVSVDLR